MVKLSKPETPDERRDVTIKDVSVTFWRAARLAAMERGQSMAAWLESVPKRMLAKREDVQ